MSNEEYLNNMNVQYSPEENEDNYEHSDSNESSNIQLERVHIKIASKIIASIMTARKEESSLS